MFYTFFAGKNDLHQEVEADEATFHLSLALILSPSCIRIDP